MFPASNLICAILPELYKVSFIKLKQNIYCWKCDLSKGTGNVLKSCHNTDITIINVRQTLPLRHTKQTPQMEDITLPPDNCLTYQWTTSHLADNNSSTRNITNWSCAYFFLGTMTNYQTYQRLVTSPKQWRWAEENQRTTHQDTGASMRAANERTAQLEICGHTWRHTKVRIEDV